MPWDVFKRSIDIALEKQIPALNFFGGEPLLNPEFFAMLKESLERGFSLLLATNCRLLADESFYDKFAGITRDFKTRIVIITARDKFHLRFFDPIGIIDKLRHDGYQVTVNDYSDNTLLLSEFNIHNREIIGLNTSFSCCGEKRSDNIGILPNGGWTICPPSLAQFGDIFSVQFSEIIEFKKKLAIRYKEGCSECLRDFKQFQKEFNKYIKLQYDGINR